MIAFRTRTIRLGTLVTPLPRRRPWMVARETVSLDHLSEGRLIFGVGSGGGPFDFESLGEVSDPKTLAALLDEGLEVLTGLWSGEPYHHEGTSYHIKEAQFLPRPVQSPRIPIWRDLPLTAMLTPEEMQEIVHCVASRPAYATPFEVVPLSHVLSSPSFHRSSQQKEWYRLYCIITAEVCTEIFSLFSRVNAEDPNLASQVIQRRTSILAHCILA